VTKAGLGLRAERADRWPDGLSLTLVACRVGPSGRAPVAAQQAAKSLVDDDLAIPPTLGRNSR
jgi:hypothetical protein